LPAEDWKPEQWATWNKTIGVPEGPDKYPAVDAQLLEKSGMSAEVLGPALKRMHELGLTPRQVKGILHDWYLPESARGSEMAAAQAKEASEKATGAVKAKYGDKYDAKAQLVKSVLALGGGDLAAKIEAAGFGNDPALFDAFVALGEKITESSAKGGAGGGSLGASKEEALQKSQTMKNERAANPTVDAKYNDPKSSERAEWNRLHQIAYAQ
jgi:hypothetical protein